MAHNKRSLAIGGLASLFLGSTLPATNTENFGFVLVNLDPAFYRGSEEIDCPQGRSLTTREAFLSTQSKSEQQRLQLPENAEEFERKYKIDYVFGPNGTDICTDAQLFDTPDRPLEKLNQSKVAFGFDLDGSTTGQPSQNSCSHDEFTSPDGDPGIDNQLFRVTGCNTFFRGAANATEQREFVWTENPTVVLVSGVDSWENDPEVQVLFAPSDDRPTLDVKQQYASGVSLTIAKGLAHRVTIKGRIRNGQLETSPADLRIRYNWLGSTGGEVIVRDFTMKVRLNADGNLVGMAGGYRPIDNAMAVPRIGGPGVANTAGLECAALRRSLRIHADGHRDPRTRQCTTLSSAMHFAATPAFVFESGKLLNSSQN